jgi:hypothetical protein
VSLLLIITTQTEVAQDKYAQRHLDSILRKVIKLKRDTVLIKVYGDVVNAYLALKTGNSASPTDTSVIRATIYARNQRNLAQMLKWDNGMVYSYGSLGKITL